MRLPVLILVATSLACAGDIGTVDRTQPGKLRKQALEGEWYFRQTVVDVPYTTGITFIGEQSLLEARKANKRRSACGRAPEDRHLAVWGSGS